MTIRERLRELKFDSGWTNQELAYSLYMSAGSIQKKLNGRQAMTIEEAEDVAELLGYTLFFKKEE